MEKQEHSTTVGFWFFEDTSLFDLKNQSINKTYLLFNKETCHPNSILIIKGN